MNTLSKTALYTTIISALFFGGAFALNYLHKYFPTTVEVFACFLFTLFCGAIAGFFLWVLFIGNIDHNN